MGNRGALMVCSGPGAQGSSESHFCGSMEVERRPELGWVYNKWKPSRQRGLGSGHPMQVSRHV